MYRVRTPVVDHTYTLLRTVVRTHTVPKRGGGNQPIKRAASGHQPGQSGLFFSEKMKGSESKPPAKEARHQTGDALATYSK